MRQLAATAANEGATNFGTMISLQNQIRKAIEGIDASRRLGFDKVKINSVLMRGRTENELFDLLEFAKITKSTILNI